MSGQAAQAPVDQALAARAAYSGMRAASDEGVKVAERDQLSNAAFLAELLLADCDDRDCRSFECWVRGAGLPRQKWFGDFGLS